MAVVVYFCVLWISVHFAVESTKTTYSCDRENRSNPWHGDTRVLRRYIPLLRYTVNVLYMAKTRLGLTTDIIYTLIINYVVSRRFFFRLFSSPSLGNHRDYTYVILLIVLNRKIRRSSVAAKFYTLRTRDSYDAGNRRRDRIRSPWHQRRVFFF